MYTRFFGLNEKPFAITPDPRYLFMSDRHGEGLAHLVYGVTESGGFIQLTGEVGTGKTTLVRTLLGQMPAEAEVALILNPQLTAVEFLVAICEELGVPLPADRNSSKDLVDALNLHLLATHARGRRTILLVDEAQNLSAAVLEQLRLLTNLETAKQKLLQIILIAQPELRDLLSQSSLRQLAQRVTGRYHLEPLSRDEAARYIDHRLKVAGALTEIFDPAAKREVHRLSGGIPRLMNVICDRALLGAYSRESRMVTKWLVRRAAAEVSGQRLTPVFLKWAVPVFGVIGAALVIAGIWSLFEDNPSAPAEQVQTAVPGGASAAPLDEANGNDRLEPAAVSEPPGTQSLRQRLVAPGTDSGSEAAMESLFGMWGIVYDVSSGTACTQAEAQGLRCYFNRGSWNSIRQLGLPVILTLTDSRGDTHQPVLVSLSDTSGELMIADTRVTYPLEEISELWFGQYLLVWRPPDGIKDTIRRGANDASVRWLRQSLAAISPDYRPADLDSHFFDEDLERRLMDFQRQHRLRADGVAGEQTQIIINSLLGLDRTPRLVAER
ncbi:MAG: AAA family ATPase [Woeseiaceae bacterium]